MKSFIRTIKILFVKIINMLGYELVHKTKTAPVHSMKFGLYRIKKLYDSIDLIIDIGASDGSWSKLAYDFWPHSTYYLFDPLKNNYQIDGFLLKNKQIKFFELALGDYNGKVDFNISEDNYGSGIYHENSSSIKQVEIRRLDDLLHDNIDKFNNIIIKLDTHGYENEIINGSKVVLKKASVIIIEVYGFYVSKNAKLFHEITEVMDQNGFRLFDIVDVMRREEDNAFWQADAVYITKNNGLFLINEF